MAQLEQCVLDVPDGRQAGEGDGANGSVSCVAVPQDLQNMRLVIDIGNNRSIEIPLKGNLILQNSSGPPPGAAAAAGVDGDAAAQGQSEQDAVDWESLEKMHVHGVADSSQAGEGDVADGCVSCVAVPQNLQDVKDKDAEDKNQKFLLEMRGWMVTVATLFVGIAFQAVMQPPGWMPKGDWLEVYRNSYKKHHGTTADASSSSSHADGPAMISPSPSPPPAITAGQARMAYFYVFINATTFGIALSLVVGLLMIKNPPRRAMRAVQCYMALLAMTVVITFALGTSDVPSIQRWVGIYTAPYAVITIAFVLSDIILCMVYKKISTLRVLARAPLR